MILVVHDSGTASYGCRIFYKEPRQAGSVEQVSVAAVLETILELRSDPDPVVRIGATAVLASAAPLVTGATNGAIAAAYSALSSDVATMSPLWRSLAPTPAADVEGTSAFLSAVAYGFSRLRIYGLVDRDGVHVQRSRMEADALALLPVGWAGVVITQSRSGASAPTVRSVRNSR